jgi:hypothetical protein
MDGFILENKMSEIPKTNSQGPVKEKPKGFTKMRNISKQTLQLTVGSLLPEKTTAYDAAEFSTLFMFLEGVE